MSSQESTGRGGRGGGGNAGRGRGRGSTGRGRGRGGRGGRGNTNKDNNNSGKKENQQQQTTKEPSTTSGNDNVAKVSTDTAGSSGRGRGGRGQGRGGGGSNGRGRGRNNPKTQNNETPSNEDSTFLTSSTGGENSSNSKQQNVGGGRGRGGDKSQVDGRGRGGRGRGGRGSGGGRSAGNDNNSKDKNKSSQGENEAQQHTKGENNQGGGKGKGKTKNHQNKQDKSNENDAKGQKNAGGQKENSNDGKNTGKEKNKGNSKGGNNKNNNSTNKATTSSATVKSKNQIPPNQPQQTSDINYGSGESITVFHVAEKPSIAQAIAKGLAKGDISMRKSSLPVHEFVNPPFPKAPHAKKVTHKVSSVAGHVFSVDFPQQFQSWDSVDPMELFQAPIVRKPTKGSVVKHLQDQAKGCDFIVLWMDCDREGENINFEVLDCCMHLMKGGTGVANYDRVYRAYFSAINPSDIVKAYNNLGKPDKNQALSVDARQELDLKVGVAFSRFQTRFFQGRYGDLDSAVLSYGPCQTPTLGFCVQRHIDIETFKPEPYWVLELGVLKRGRMLRATWEGGRSFAKQKTESLVDTALEKSPMVTVTNVVTKEKKQGRPIPLNTVSLLKACSKALGIGPHGAMQTAERLYLSGYLSYPRTESTAYPKSFDIQGTLQQQAGDSRWGGYVRQLLTEGYKNSRGGVDMGDHPPITPCRAAGVHELSGDMARVYELVVRHFIASVSPDAVWQSTKVEFEIESLGPKGKFFLAGKELVTPGFLAILLHKEYGDSAGDDDAEEDEEERSIPEFVKGEQIPLLKGNTSSGSSKVSVATASPVWASLDVKEKKTTPPGYLTESELIGMMEKHGIGTDASIATHIQNIQNRNYVHLETGRRLIPSKLGMVLVQGYHQIDSGLVLPKVRSDIEGQCNKIARGDMEKDAVVRKAIELFEEKFAFFIKNIDRMDVLFGSSFSKLEDVGKAFTRCGFTRRYLQFIPGPPPRLYNRFTESVYPLPVGGDIKQWSGRSCPVEGCNFELCLYSVGAPPRTFPLCPNCFNSPDWALGDGDDDDTTNGYTKDADDKADAHKEKQIKKMAGKSLTLECPLPDDHPLIDELYVTPDPDSDGIFIMDPHFGPKWRLVATRDATIIHLPQSIDKITILDEKEEVLGCHKLKIEFKENQSPYEGGAQKHTCFYPTDVVLQNSSRVFHGSERTASKGRGGRGRGRGGRGRGRGGRGRGGRGRGSR